MKVYGDKEDFSAAQQVFINKLQADLQNHQEIQGILEYMNNSLSVLGNLEKRMAKIGSGELSKEEEFKALRNVRNYLNSYGVIMNDIRKQMNEASREGDDSIKENIKDILNQNDIIIKDLASDFYEIAKDKFTEFIRPFVGDGSYGCGCIPLWHLLLLSGAAFPPQQCLHRVHPADDPHHRSAALCAVGLPLDWRQP